MQDSLKGIVGNASWLFAQKAWSLAISFFVSVFVARYLGPTDFGVLSFGLSFVNLFAFLSTLGLKNLVIIDLVRYPDRTDQILGTTFYFKLIGGAIAYAITLTIAEFSLGHETRSVLIIAILGSALFFNAIKSIEIWNVSQTRSKYTALGSILSSASSSAIKVGLVIVEAPLYAFALTIVFEWMLEAAILIYFFKRQGRDLWRWRMNWSLGWSWLKESWYLILSGASASIYLKIDQVMLGQMKDMAEVGQYAVAARLSEAVYFIPGTIVSSVFPFLIKTRDQNNPEEYNRRMRQLYGILGSISFVIALVATFAGPIGVPILYGDQFSTAGWILTIHTWASLPVFLGAGMSQWLTTERMFKFSLYRHASGAIVNIVLNFILIPPYGAFGAAVATVISYIVANWAICLPFEKTRPQALLMITGWREVFSPNMWKTFLDLLRRKRKR